MCQSATFYFVMESLIDMELASSSGDEDHSSVAAHMNPMNNYVPSIPCRKVECFCSSLVVLIDQLWLLCHFPPRRNLLATVLNMSGGVCMCVCVWGGGGGGGEGHNYELII